MAAHPLIQPGICRYVVNQTFAGVPVVNILDVHVDTTGSTVSREDGCLNVGGDIINNWCNHILARQVSALSFDSVSWVDLDSLTGSTGLRTATASETLPQIGGLLTNSSPGNVSALVTKQAPGGGRSTRNGRMYIAGVAESHTDDIDPNLLEPAQVTAWNTALAAFLDGVNDPGGPAAEGSALAVVHTRLVDDPDEPGEKYPVAIGYSIITALAINARLASQRRRTGRS